MSWPHRRVVTAAFQPEMGSCFSANREDVKNSLTKKRENGMTAGSSTLTRESNVEQVDSTDSSRSSRRQSSRNFGISPRLEIKCENLSVPRHGDTLKQSVREF
jgi:hypothetical protein